MLESREDIDKLLTLLKSTNPELQQNALKNFMFVSTTSSVIKFLEPDNLKLLVDLSGSSNMRVETSALRLLWHLSAQAEMKCILYEEGVFERIKSILDKENTDDHLACAAVLQNISEHRFLKGELNPNQVKLVNDGILPCISTLIKSDDKRVQFLACLTVCNLAMNSENHKKIEKSGLLNLVEQFVLDNQLHVDMVCHWLTLQPHIPLLHSTLRQVQLFSLSSLLVLVKSETYKVEVWRCTSMNEGVGIIFELSRSKDGSISKLASDVISVLQLEEPLIKCSPCDVGHHLGKMFDNPEFSDIKFICDGGVIHGHKAILAARCPQFHAMFTHFKESKQDEIEIHPDIMSFSTFKIICEFIYTGVAKRITRSNAVEVLIAAEFYALPELKQYCERFLWFYIDTQNVAQLFKTAQMHAAYQLSRVCADFMFRNFSRVCQSDGFNELEQDDRDDITILMKGREKEKEKKTIKKDEVDSQGQHAERGEIGVNVEGMAV